MLHHYTLLKTCQTDRASIYRRSYNIVIYKTQTKFHAFTIPIIILYLSLQKKLDRAI